MNRNNGLCTRLDLTVRRARIGAALYPRHSIGSLNTRPSEFGCLSHSIRSPKGGCGTAKYAAGGILCSMSSPLLRIRDLAEGQWGLVTLRQARATGVGWQSIVRLTDSGLLERVAHGVYRVRGAAEPDHLGLRAAWLQLDPSRPAWERQGDPDVAVVSHTSAAALYAVGDLRADVHEFTVPHRRQTRRPDIRLHRGSVPEHRKILILGLPTTRAGRMVGDLLADNVDPDSVARITVEVLDRVLDYPRVVAQCLAPYAARFGLPKGDGVALLDDLLLRANYRDKDDVISLASHE